MSDTAHIYSSQFSEQTWGVQPPSAGKVWALYRRLPDEQKRLVRSLMFREAEGTALADDIESASATKARETRWHVLDRLVEAVSPSEIEPIEPEWVRGWDLPEEEPQYVPDAWLSELQGIAPGDSADFLIEWPEEH